MVVGLQQEAGQERVAAAQGAKPWTRRAEEKAVREVSDQR